MEEISTLENDIKGIKEAIDAKNAPMMVSYCCGFSGFSLLGFLNNSLACHIYQYVILHMEVNGWGYCCCMVLNFFFWIYNDCLIHAQS